MLDSAACVETPGTLSQRLEELSLRPLSDRLLLVRRLAGEVFELHQRAAVHRAICVESVALDDQLQPQLPDPPAMRGFGGEDVDWQGTPPELSGGPGVELPADATVAARLLEKNGHPLAPWRIDVYQLGVVLCEVLTGHPVRDYMLSPSVKGLVPPPVRHCLGSALGFDADNRYEDCASFIAGLDDAIRAVTPVAISTSAVDTRPLGEARATGGTAPDNLQPPAPRAPVDDLPFRRLGPFEILERIGSGGMGDVYKGYDESLQRIVAVKVLPAEMARSADFLARFRHEASAVARLEHPNTISIHYVGEDEGRHFFAMQYVEGQSLAARLDRPDRPSLDETLEVIRQCLAGLQAAHAEGLIHRDVKPANILLERDTGRAVLIDFGLVRRANDAARLTAPGAMLGTADYIAPEQGRGQPADHRADLYALGVVMYRMLAGVLPFSGDTPTAVIYQHAHEPPPPLGSLVPELPPQVIHLVEKMLAKDPAQRYQTAGEILEELRALERGQAAAVAPRTRAHAGLPWCNIHGHRPPQPRPRAHADLSGLRLPAPTATKGRRTLLNALRLRGWRWAAVGSALALLGMLAIGNGLFPGEDEAALPDNPPAAAKTVELGQPLAESEWVDVLASVDPQWDTVSGQWRRQGNDLAAGPDPFSRILLPVELEGSYDLSAEFTRHADRRWPTAIIFPVGSRTCMLYLDAWSVHGLERIDGRMVEDRLNPAVRRPGVLINGQKYSVTVAVRVDGDRAEIDAKLDGESLVSWKGKQLSLDLAPFWTLPKPFRPALVAHGAPVTYHTALVRAISGRSRMVKRATPPAVDLNDPQWQDLLAALDLERDTIRGRWRKIPDGLAVAPASQDERFVRLMFSQAVEESYDLAVDFTRTLGNDSVTITLPVGARQCTLHFGAAVGQLSGLERIDRLSIKDRYNPTLRRASGLVNGRRYQAFLQVRTGGNCAMIDVWLDGKPFVHWAGLQSSLNLAPSWMLPERNRAGIGANQNNVTFHAVRLRPVEPENRDATDRH